MDYLPRWIEIRETFKRTAPAVAVQFAPDPLEPIFAEIDRRLHEDDWTEPYALEDRLRDQLHAIAPHFQEVMFTLDEGNQAALTTVQEAVWELFGEYSHLVMQRQLHLETHDDHPFHAAIEHPPESAG